MDETTTPQAAPAAAPAPVADNADVDKNKTIAALSYLIFFLPLLTDAKNSKFAMFHANQGLLVLITWVISWIVVVIPILGWIAGFILWIASIVFFFMGLINALNGKMKPLPIIGDIHLIDKA